MSEAKPKTQSWIGLIWIGIAFALCVWLSWRKWAEIIVDFGTQLYLAWRLSEGDLLYRDVMHLPGGPFSQYFNALLFKIFGVSFRTLIFANLTISAGMIVLIYRRFLAATDQLTSTTIGVIVVVAFAFAHYTNGNYNYVTPYSHEAFHSLALSVLTIVLLSSWIEKKRLREALGAGLCAGLVFLTKPDVFVALSAGLAAALVLIRMERSSFEFILKSAGLFIAAAFLPLLFFFFFFLRFENVADALHSVVFAWGPVLGSSVTRNGYYLWCMGLDTPFYHIFQTVSQSVVVVTVTFLYAILFRRKIQTSRDKIILMAWSAILLAGASIMDWTDAAYPLPLICMFLLILLWLYYKNPMLKSPPVFPVLWTVFALVLPLKMGLFCRIWHYGFVLAMPAFVAAMYFMLWILPIWLEKFGVQRTPFRWLMWMILVFGCLQLFAQSQLSYIKKTLSLGNGADTVKTFDRDTNLEGAGMISAISWMQSNVPLDSTLAVLPEGAMVNYLTRRINPTGYAVWMPPELQVFGQTNMTTTFQRHSPDYVMLLHNENAVKAYHGVKHFGLQPENGLALMQWIRQNYDVVFQVGAVPLQTTNFGVQLLKRHPSLQEN